MNNYVTQIGNAKAVYNTAGTKILRYTVEMAHDGLKEHKIISAPEFDMLENKAGLQRHKWEEKWSKIESKRKNTAAKEANKEEANLRTVEAIDAIHGIDNLLVHTLSVDDTVDWDRLKKDNKYTEDRPTKPRKKTNSKYPIKPKEEIPTFKWIEKLFSSKKEKKIQQFKELNATIISEWEKQKSSVDNENEKRTTDYNNKLSQWDIDVSRWEKRKNNFYHEQDLFNMKIDQLKQEYFDQNQESIIEYCDMVLNNSEYPDTFPKNFELDYNPENKMLIVEYEFPSLELLPSIKEVKYIATRNELKETFVSEPQKHKLFDEAIYKITLRTLHELFEADVINAIDTISLNGWVIAVNKATGKEENNCILSIQTRKNEFTDIDLANVDPKTCFKGLKGIASSKLSSLTPIKPILQIAKSDRRFVESYEVANQLDRSTNLAAMDWEDFEHLIRELFEKEFQSNGGEVKVTQASRDGGVDAIAYDPDPIRGGKIVIQAKRYTNTVGVSAVRDLYGTVMNEGATKGILVTTADYGPDAYSFANGKPLTLLNGSNLLHLLKNHGYQAKVDLREAKKILAEKEMI